MFPSQSGALTSAPVAPAPTVTAATGNYQANFGLSQVAIEEKEVAAGKRPPEPTSMEAHIDHVGASADGLVVFNLDNGQVWRQIAVAGDLLARSGDLVKISRGMLGSYYLQLKSGRGCKVHRIS